MGVKVREEWDGRMGFVMAAIGSAVGLGNVWRFPYVCYQNGGGAFLVPYLIALLSAGIPLMILEYALGHKMVGAAPITFSRIGKKWEWIGWAMVLSSFVVVAYYAVVMAWCFNYLFYSFDLKWGADTTSFFYNQFLRISDSPLMLGGIRLPILIALVAVWICIYLIIFRGVKTVGKVVMYTVPLPVILIAVLVVRGLTLPGAREGLLFYLTPDFSVLNDTKVWLAAYAQIFFSLSLGFGVLITYASYLPRKSDIANNAFITSFANCGTSFFAGFAIFSVLGYLAQSTGVGVGEVAKGGAGLAFEVYPKAISLLPVGGRIFGATFFILLLTLAIDSAFSLVEGIVAGVVDHWKLPRRAITLFICLLAFLSGVIFTTRSGLYWLDIVDHYILNFGITLAGLAECIVVGYILGASHVREHINAVSEIKIGIWWDLCIMIITPAILGYSFIVTLAERLITPYGGYPQRALVYGGWSMLAVVVSLALALSRRWLLLGSLVTGGVIVWLLTLILPLGASMMLVVGLLVLIGSLLYSVHIALKGDGFGT